MDLLSSSASHKSTAPTIDLCGNVRHANIVPEFASPSAHKPLLFLHHRDFDIQYKSIIGAHAKVGAVSLEDFGI